MLSRFARSSSMLVVLAVMSATPVGAQATDADQTPFAGSGSLSLELMPGRWENGGTGKVTVIRRAAPITNGRVYTTKCLYRIDVHYSMPDTSYELWLNVRSPNEFTSVLGGQQDDAWVWLWPGVADAA